MTLNIDATYSVEDNKLRLYASERLDRDLFLRIKEAGFKWAPKQALFVAPKWTPSREDLCIELAGEIGAEQTTVIERAEAKAERLDELAEKRQRQSNSFHDAAQRLSERFASGQPILVGHHSERKARRDQERMHSAMDQAVKAANAVEYWNSRAVGVELHANRTSSDKVRAGRIKKLLKELRDHQRYINHAHLCVDLWQKVCDITDGLEFRKTCEYWAGARLKTGATCRWGAWSELTDGSLDHRQFVNDTLAAFERNSNAPTTFRWINHTLNRLAFERSELGEVTRYDGEFSVTLLQAFAREHGAHKPKASAALDGLWILESSVPLPALPAHVADGCSIEASEDQWRDLMQDCGYVVPEKKVRRKSSRVQVPLINPSKEDAERLQRKWNDLAIKKHSAKYVGSTMAVRGIKAITQARYSANSKGSYTPFKTIELDQHGERVWHSYKGKSGEPVCRIRKFSGGHCLYAPDSIVLIDDKPQKALPISWETQIVEAKT